MNIQHNLEFEKNASQEIKERNGKLLLAYDNILITIDRIQGFLEDEYLRNRIESKMFLNEETKTTILQCTTPWILLSLGCDSIGRYNIVYSIDYRIQEMIGQEMSSGIIRRIYEYTPGDMEPFVRIGSLYVDCIEVFNKLIEEQKTQSFHTHIIRELNK